MRTYSNFLLFEDVLTNLPVGSSIIQAAANTLMLPEVPVVEADCGTLLGTITKVDYSAVGLTELANNTKITITRVDYLRSIGVSSIRTRNTSTCTSKGGICQACLYSAIGSNSSLDGTWLLDGSRTLNGTSALASSTANPVGSIAKILPDYQFATQVIVGDGINNTFICSQPSYLYTSTSLLASTATIVDGKIIFVSIPALGEIIVIHYFTTSSNPFLEYIAKTYSGGMLGIAPLPSFPLVLKPSLYQSLFSPTQLVMLQAELNKYAHNIPPTYISYCDTITDPLEKVLMIIYLYAIYANVN